MGHKSRIQKHSTWKVTDTGPSRATAGPEKSFSCRERGIQMEESWGGVSTAIIIRLGVWGSVVSSSSGVRGGALAENGFDAYLSSERSHLKHPFQYFWAMAGPPKRRGARINFPPFPPLSMSLNWHAILPNRPIVTQSHTMITWALARVTFLFPKCRYLICYNFASTTNQFQVKIYKLCFILSLKQTSFGQPHFPDKNIKLHSPLFLDVLCM